MQSKLSYTKTKIKMTFKQKIIPLGGNGPPCPSLEKHLSLLEMGEPWLKGKMDERECGWLERQMVSRNPLGQHKSMQGRNVLRVTPHPPFIVFPRDFRVLSPWSRI